MARHKDLLTKEEAVELLGVKPDTVKNMCRVGTLAVIKVGRSSFSSNGRTFVHRLDLESLLKSRRAEGKRQAKKKAASKR